MKPQLKQFSSIIEKEVLKQRGYALVWMSAGNSYFREEVIEKILSFTGKNFIKTIVMAPDEPAEHTYSALGYGENKAKKKARLNANLLQNRARRIVESFKDKSKFHVVEWIEEIIPNSFYQKNLKEINNLYKTNEDFRKDAKKTTLAVLKSKGGIRVKVDEAVSEAVNYLLKELAFVVASPEIFNIEKITYIYHKDWPIYKKLIAGKYDGIKRHNLSFFLYK